MVSVRPRRTGACLTPQSASSFVRSDSHCSETITDRTGCGRWPNCHVTDRSMWSRSREGCLRCTRRHRSSVVPERVEERLGREPLRNGSQVGRTDSWVGTSHSLEGPCIPVEPRILGGLDWEPRTPSSRCPTERSRSVGSSSSAAEERRCHSRRLDFHRSIVRNSSRPRRENRSSSSSRCEADCRRRSHIRSEQHRRHCGSSNRPARRARRSGAASCIARRRARPRSLERESSQPATAGC